MDKKTYFISGASSGIGEDISKTLLSKGHIVIGCGLEESPNINHNNFIYFQCDIIDYKALNLKLQDILKSNSITNIDGLITSAGDCGVAENIFNTSEDRFFQLFNVNVMGTYYTIKAILNYMSEGSIITISSSLATKPVQNCIAYSPAKAAICQLTKNLALELSPKIRVNSIAPSYIDTPMTRRDPEKDEMRKALVNNYPLKRIGYVDDVTNAVMFLLSNESSFITGEVLRVSGGGHLR